MGGQKVIHDWISCALLTQMTLIWTKLLRIKNKTQAKANSTFGNVERVYLFKEIEKAIKQMKKLQNLGIMKHDRIDIGHIEH